MAYKSRVGRYEESGRRGYLIARFAVCEVPRDVDCEVCSLLYEVRAEYFLPTFDHIFYLYTEFFGVSHSGTIDEKVFVGNRYRRTPFGSNTVSSMPDYVLYARRCDTCRFVIGFRFGFAERIDNGFVFIEPSLVVSTPDAKVFAARREEGYRGEQ